ncbi:MAG: hypothetical protein ACLFM9_00380 [Candidatus Aenigmatarchaeota archaeon]
MLRENGKGDISLSIRTVMLMSLGLIVLIGLIMIFTGGLDIGLDLTDCDAVIEKNCGTYVANGCCDEGNSCNEVVADFDLPDKCTEPSDWSERCC